MVAFYGLNPLYVKSPPPPIAFRGAWGWCGGCGFVVRWVGKNEKKPQRKWGFWNQGKSAVSEGIMSDRVWTPPPAVLVVLWFCVWSLPGNTSARFSGHQMLFEKIRDKGAGILVLINRGGKRMRPPWENRGGRVSFNCFNCIVLTHDFWLITRIARCYCLCIYNKKR